MLNSSSQRQKAGAALIASGAALAIAGLYLLAGTDRALIGGVVFGTGVLDLVLGLYFLRA